jgi:hypothetical protein
MIDISREIWLQQFSFKRAFLVSMVLAGTGFEFPYWYPRDGFDQAIFTSIGLGMLWFFFFVISLKRWKKQGLWFLIVAPLAFYWTLEVILITVGCWGGYGCP